MSFTLYSKIGGGYFDYLKETSRTKSFTSYCQSNPDIAGGVWGYCSQGLSFEKAQKRSVAIGGGLSIPTNKYMIFNIDATSYLNTKGYTLVTLITGGLQFNIPESFNFN